MKLFFYYTRNVIGLILVLGPLCGLLLDTLAMLIVAFAMPVAGTNLAETNFFPACPANAADGIPDSSGFFIPILFLVSLLAGLILTIIFYNNLPFRAWICMSCLISAYGCFLVKTEPLSPSAVIGLCLAGIFSAGLLMTLPSSVVTGWFRMSKLPVLAVVWSVSVVLAVLWFFLLQYSFFLCTLLGILFMLAGAILFLEKPPFPAVLTGPDVSVFHSHFIKNQGQNLFRTRIFFAIICFSLGNCLQLADWSSLISPPNKPASAVLPPVLLLTAAFAPYIAGLFISRKGIFSQCILQIFLAEIAVMCFSAANSPRLHAAGLLVLMLCFSMLFTTLPILVYYLYGPADYPRRSGSMWSAVPAGLLASFLCAKSSVSGYYQAEALSLSALGLLVFSFFAIFSAWKHRLAVIS